MLAPIIVRALVIIFLLLSSLHISVNAQFNPDPGLPIPLITSDQVYPDQEPAGCLSVESGSGYSPSEKFEYGKSLSPAAARVLSNPILIVWNSITGKRERLTPGNFAFLIPASIPLYEVDVVRRAMHVSGFASWIRLIPGEGAQLLLFSPITPNNNSSLWDIYYQQYWEKPSQPTFDPYLQPISPHLPPCRWMRDLGLLPVNTSPEWVSGWTWEYPDYSRLTAKYVALSTEEANRVAYRINWIENGDLESPTNMCGPLTWDILKSTNSFPPGIGEWSRGPISFWLPDPKLTGKPWIYFSPNSYEKYKFKTPLNKFAFKDFPLYPGDIVYAYAEGDGDDHIFIVVDRDLGGRTFTISNFIQIVPTYKVTIQYSLLYDPHSPGGGVIRNEWSDPINGRTGHNGFEIFRWKWLIKDLKGEEQIVKVQPGDTILELSIRWKTHPNLIIENNKINKDHPLQIGQLISIPPQPLPDRFRADLPIPPVDNNLVFTRYKFLQAK